LLPDVPIERLQFPQLALLNLTVLLVNAWFSWLPQVSVSQLERDVLTSFYFDLLVQDAYLSKQTSC